MCPKTAPNLGTIWGPLECSFWESSWNQNCSLGTHMGTPVGHCHPWMSLSQQSTTLVSWTFPKTALKGSPDVLNSASHKPDRQFLFAIVFWMSRGKETWERICKHLLQISRFRLVVLRSHAALCYAVNHCYVYLVTQTSGPTAAWGLKLLFHLETQPKLSWAPKPTLGPLKGLKLGFKEPEEFPLVFLVWNGSSLLEYKRGPQLGTLWQFTFGIRLCKLQLHLLGKIPSI